MIYIQAMSLENFISLFKCVKKIFYSAEQRKSFNSDYFNDLEISLV
ncbi:hypothetical protein DFA_02108 [Cavenderia fasciculata]|uniref:Uncharacterized protein n=1 Tax=Cavenderia fasciculata TaxID=261658 RepID=F4PYQ5_CACFS|nr:uncharacterized protein DFA_02108 [Cavenderia fasciculata]EGG19321.1 hypothetical protein DFA_02108 [Cavenderia fasciculata]|eukprot:XP_004357592.1 hypothetical protein DFA_02108 [Cavenderia fasciculata]